MAEQSAAAAAAAGAGAGAGAGAWGQLTRTHLKMSLLKARFSKQVELEQAATVEDAAAAAAADGTTASETSPSRGKQRWSRIRQVVTGSNSGAGEGEGEEESKFASVEEEDASLGNFWKSIQPPPPPLDLALSAAAVAAAAVVTEFDFDRDFAVAAEQVSVSISKVPDQVLQHEKSRLEARLFEQRELALDAIRTRESDLVWREVLARQRVESLEEAARVKVATEREKAEATFLEREKLLGRDFRRAREELELEIKRRNCALVEEFGHLGGGAGSGLPSSRLLRLRSGVLPQPIEIRIHHLRAVKEKLPKGAYVLMLSQYESLGGQPLGWSKLTMNGIGPSYPAVTAAARHQGRFFDKMLKFEDSVFALGPSQECLKPGFCLVLELFQLSSSSSSSSTSSSSSSSPALDKCVAWSALPLCTEHFTVPQGKYKLPFLKGAHSPLVQNYKDMERAMGSDINNWLCNGYVEIKTFPLADVLATLESSAADVLRTKSLRLQYDYLNKRMVGVSAAGTVSESSPWSIKTGLFQRRNKPAAATSLSASASKGSMMLASIGNRSLLHGTSQDSPFSSPRHRRQRGSGSSYFSSALQWVFGTKTESVSNKYASRDGDDEEVHVFAVDADLAPEAAAAEPAPAPASSTEVQVLERGYREEDELFLHSEQRGKLAGVETVDDADDRRWAAAGLEGDVVRRWQSDGVRLDSEIEPSSVGDASSRRAQPNSGWGGVLDNARDMELYTYSIASNPSQRKRLLPGAIAAFKLRFLVLEALGDLYPHMWGSLDAYITLLVLVIALWLRIYLHYMGQYVYLAGAGAPIFAFELQPLQISFKYMSSSISQAAEIGLVAIGPITNNLFFIAFSLLGSVIHALTAAVPEGYNKFVSCFGIAALVDPLLVLIVDLGYHNYNCGATSGICSTDYTSGLCHCFTGDFSKLWNRTQQDEGSGISGLIITLIIYLGNSCVSSLVLVEYLVHVHRNARILDIWRRISAPPQEFFLPEDFEVSHEELTSICKRAESWRGGGGSRRRIVVHNYTETDAVDATYRNTTSHVAIYELAANGVPLKIHRQFLVVRADGGGASIVETFGPLNLGATQIQAKGGEATVALNSNIPDSDAFARELPKHFDGLQRF